MSDISKSGAAYHAMEQRPAADLKAESPLYAARQSVTESATDNPGVTLRELPLQTHLVIRGKNETVGFSEAFTQVLGMALPTRLQWTAHQERVARWISPDEWLVTAPNDEAYALETQLRQVLPGHCAVVNVSGGQTGIVLAGPQALKVLKKSTSYDLSAQNFSADKVVTTLLGKSQMVLRALDKDAWELIVRRSFADYIWLWLQDAAVEYGVRVHAG